MGTLTSTRPISAETVLVVNSHGGTADHGRLVRSRAALLGYERHETARENHAVDLSRRAAGAAGEETDSSALEVRAGGPDPEPFRFAGEAAEFEAIAGDARPGAVEMPVGQGYQPSPPGAPTVADIDLHSRSRFVHWFAGRPTWYDGIGARLHVAVAGLRGLDVVAVSNHDYSTGFDFDTGGPESDRHRTWSLSSGDPPIAAAGDPPVPGGGCGAWTKPVTYPR